MAGITVAEALRMSPEELMKHSNSQEFYIDGNGTPHMALNFSDDDNIPSGVIEDIVDNMVKEFNKNC